MPARPHPLSVLPVLAALLLTACGPDGAPPIPPRSSSDASAGRGEQVITGNATYLEQVQLPPDSVLVVQLLDLRPERRSAGPAVLSHVRLVNVRGPSIPFALPYDSAEVREPGRHALQARLTDAAGRALFATDAPVAVEPGRVEPIEFRMVQVGDALTRRIRHWQCGPLRVDARFNESNNTVGLALSGRTLQLPLAISGSGARYADEHGNEFWDKGTRASLILAGERQPDCAPTDGPSPWADAAERGVGFRAIGNEPGWWVEVDHGEAPALRAVVDYGERQIEVAHAQPAGLGFVGETADGVDVRLEIAREPCDDGMSGERFEASAQLTVGGRSYRGCGAFLPD